MVAKVYCLVSKKLNQNVTKWAAFRRKVVHASEWATCSHKVFDLFSATETHYLWHAMLWNPANVFITSHLHETVSKNRWAKLENKLFPLYNSSSTITKFGSQWKQHSQCQWWNGRWGDTGEKTTGGVFAFPSFMASRNDGPYKHANRCDTLVRFLDHAIFTIIKDDALK